MSDIFTTMLNQGDGWNICTKKHKHCWKNIQKFDNNLQKIVLKTLFKIKNISQFEKLNFARKKNWFCDSFQLNIFLANF